MLMTLFIDHPVRYVYLEAAIANAGDHALLWYSLSIAESSTY